MTQNGVKSLPFGAENAMKYVSGWRLLKQRSNPNCNPCAYQEEQPLNPYMLRGRSAQGVAK